MSPKKPQINLKDCSTTIFKISSPADAKILQQKINQLMLEPKKKTQDELWDELLGLEERGLYITYAHPAIETS